MGRHQTEEIFALGKQDIDALAAYLGHKPYFFGDRPTTLDASAFGLLINISGCPIESPLKEHALTINQRKSCRLYRANYAQFLSGSTASIK